MLSWLPASSYDDSIEKEGAIVSTIFSPFEPTHEIMALIALRKLNLQTRMRINPLGLHV